MLRQHPLAEGVDFDLAHANMPGALKSQVNTADAGEERDELEASHYRSVLSGLGSNSPHQSSGRLGGNMA